MILQVLGILLLAWILWSFLLSPLYKYLQFGRALGFDKVCFLYKPLTGFEGILEWSQRKYQHSYGFYIDAIRKNPNLKIMIVKMSMGILTYVLDAEMLRKMMNDYYKLLPKPDILIFGNEVNKGLVFTEGNEWKKSRSILSELFHFEMLRARESMIKSVVEDKVKGLDKEKPHLFKLGCSIGGEVVVKSLFGEQFFGVKFGKNNPYEQIHELLGALVTETRNVVHILRYIASGNVKSNSKHLLESQRQVLQRLMKFKSICKQYIEKSKIKYENKQPLAPFLEAYFKLHDDSYHEEMIHQLFLFLSAGEDTTGSLIEKCLAMLATYPEYQERILKDIQQTNVYSSKELTNFINQVNRNQSPVSLAASRIVLEPFTIDGYTFEKGSKIQMATTAPMMNPRFWDHPEKFDPDRFNHPIDNPMAFIPFSAGPRNCIGQHMALMQVKLTIQSILSKYTLHKAGTSLESHSSTIINYLVDPYYVRFQKK